MLTVRTMPVLMRTVGKLDLDPIVTKLKELDIFDDVVGKKNALEQLTAEKVGILGMELIPVILPQLDRIADEIVPLVAAYKKVTPEEAEDLDAAEVINEIINDEGIRSFFVTALRKKAAQGA